MSAILLTHQAEQPFWVSHLFFAYRSSGPLSLTRQRTAQHPWPGAAALVTGGTSAVAGAGSTRLELSFAVGHISKGAFNRCEEISYHSEMRQPLGGGSEQRF